MTNNSAIHLAIEGLHFMMKDKLWDSQHPINDYGLRCKEFCDKCQEAIRILEGLKDK